MIIHTFYRIEKVFCENPDCIQRARKVWLFFGDWYRLGRKIIILTKGHNAYGALKSQPTQLLLYARDAINQGYFESECVVCPHRFLIRECTSFEHKIFRPIAEQYIDTFDNRDWFEMVDQINEQHKLTVYLSTIVNKKDTMKIDFI